MSKAFLRESDDNSFDETIFPPMSSLARGEKNYLTPDGARRLRAELVHLRTDSRPPLAAHITDPDAKRELQRVDHQIRRLEQSLQTAEILEPPAGDLQVVEFGAVVVVRDKEGATDRYRIVGVDEIDAARGWISHQSPLGRALLRAKVGQRIVFQTPRGKIELEILAVSYGPEAQENTSD